MEKTELTDKLFGSKWRITTEQRQYVPQKKFTSKRTGEIYWRDEGYFNTLEGAVGYIVKNRVINKQKKYSLAEYVNTYKDMFNEIMDNLSVQNHKI